MPNDTGHTFSRREFLERTCATGAALAASLAVPVSAALAQETTGPVYPDDAFSRPPIDVTPWFERTDGCAPGGDTVSRAAAFVENTVLRASGPAGPHTVWRVTSRESAGTALMIAERLRREPIALSFEVTNTSADEIRLVLSAHELAWLPQKENSAVAWVLGEWQPVAPGATATLHYQWADAKPMGAAVDRPPRFPIVALALHLSGNKPGSPCELRLRRLTVEYAPAPDLRVTGLVASTELHAEQHARFRVFVEGTVPRDQPVDLEVRREPYVLWRVRLSAPERRTLASERTITVSRTVPSYIAPGQVTVGLVVAGCRVAGAEAAALARNDRQPGLPNVSREVRNGRPVCVVDGRSFPWSGYSSYDYQPGSVTEFATHGASMLCIPVAAGAHVYAGVAAQDLVAPNRWDFGELEERVAFSLQANPSGFLALRASLALPRFWTQSHEPELCRVRAPGGDLVWYEGGGYAAPSIASEAWRRDQSESLRHLLRYVASRPWADRVVAIWLSAETTEEWFAWGSNDGRLGDYSAPNQERFRGWLASHTLPAPDTPSVVPSTEARGPAGWDLHPDTPDGRLAAQYSHYSNQVAAETISWFARVVKEETNARLLVGTFYGYVIQLAGESRQATSGNFALREVLADPNVDFLGGVPLHDFRTLRDGYDPYVSATESIQAAGKLYCNENDLFSWLHPLHWHVEYDPDNPRAGAVAMHRRECGHDAVSGVLSQRFSLACSWHHDAALQDEFAHHARIVAEAQRLDRSPVEEIAFVVDDTSFGWFTSGSMLTYLSHKRLLHDLGMTGAPVGVWLLADLPKLPKRVRLVVVASAPAPRPEDAEALRHLIESGGRTVLCVGPVGLIDAPSGAWRPSRPGELLGLPLDVVADWGRSGMVLADSGAWVTPEGVPLRPRAAARAAGLLRYPDGAHASAERPLAAGGRLIWCGLPPVSTPLLRTWAAEAGVHLYAPAGHTVWASQGLVSVTSAQGGAAKLLWPGTVTARDLFDGTTAAGREMQWAFAPGQTRLLAVTRAG